MLSDSNDVSKRTKIYCYFCKLRSIYRLKEDDYLLLQEKLRAYSFSASEKQVVAYLLEQQKNIQAKTTTQIAKETFTSKSTLVRIAQKLNYSGWIALKNDFIKEIDYLEQSPLSVDANFPFQKKDSLMTVANNIAKLERDSIEETCSLLTHDQLRTILNILSPAKKIHVFAVSNNLLLANRFQHQMKRIKKDVCIHQLQSEILFDSYLATEDSCAILLSYSGETSILVEVADILKSKQVPIILITSMGENSLTKKASAILRTSTREKIYSKISSYSTDISIEYLLDVLYSCVFHEAYEKHLSLKLDASKMIEKDHFSNTSILQEN